MRLLADYQVQAVTHYSGYVQDFARAQVCVQLQRQASYHHCQPGCRAAPPTLLSHIQHLDLIVEHILPEVEQVVPGYA